jgi:hypothetical protein
MKLPVPRNELDTVSQRVVKALTNLGHAYRRRDGTTQSIVFRRRGITQSGSMLLLEVDTERLPRGVNTAALVAPSVLHHLTTVTHHPVQVLNTTGITYVVHLGRTSLRARLPDTARLAEVLPRHPGTPLTFPVGASAKGPVWVRLDKLNGHFLVGGQPRAGKTTWLLAMLLSLTLTNAPAALQLVLVDPKAVDFAPFADAPHLAQPLAVEPDEAAAAVVWLVQEMERRRQLFRACGVDKWPTYNAQAAQQLPYLLAVIDEVTVLVQERDLRGPLAANLVLLSTYGLTFGICLVLATQKPLARVLDTLVRDNLAVRVAFQVTTLEHSRVILGMTGAEHLPRVRGRMLARLGEDGEQELQGYLVTREDLPTPLDRDPRALLDGVTQRMLTYAVEQLGGRFPEREICRRLSVSQGQYRQARRKLLQTGLLTRGDNNALVVVAGIIP